MTPMFRLVEELTQHIPQGPGSRSEAKKIEASPSPSHVLCENN